MIVLYIYESRIDQKTTTIYHVIDRSINYMLFTEENCVCRVESMGVQQQQQGRDGTRHPTKCVYEMYIYIYIYIPVYNRRPLWWWLSWGEGHLSHLIGIIDIVF